MCNGVAHFYRSLDGALIPEWELVSWWKGLDQDETITLFVEKIELSYQPFKQASLISYISEFIRTDSETVELYFYITQVVLTSYIESVLLHFPSKRKNCLWWHNASITHHGWRMLLSGSEVADAFIGTTGHLCHVNKKQLILLIWVNNQPPGLSLQSYVQTHTFPDEFTLFFQSRPSTVMIVRTLTSFPARGAHNH